MHTQFLYIYKTTSYTNNSYKLSQYNIQSYSEDRQIAVVQMFLFNIILFAKLRFYENMYGKETIYMLYFEYVRYVLQGGLIYGKGL